MGGGERDTGDSFISMIAKNLGISVGEQPPARGVHLLDLTSEALGGGKGIRRGGGKKRRGEEGSGNE